MTNSEMSTSALNNLKLIKKNFNKILHLEEFSLYDYNPFDLSGYDDEKKNFDETLKGKKDVTPDPFFTPSKSAKKTEDEKHDCSNNIFDTRCHIGLKIGIWFLITLSIIMTCLFIWYIFHKMSNTAAILPVEQATTQQLTLPEIEKVNASSASEQNNPIVYQQLEENNNAHEKDNFLGRLFGSRHQLPRKPKKQGIWPRVSDKTS